ncbi:DUF2817 domain-containing protein [uncultured Sphingorhabdus sp.]|uniref:DUF2817 domain-containing protein n=1 Tax=uncultured Sphingorhabdus sp. TaxID=1686106 RepID=UPI002602A46A|nr:DUF2817 domain-containing protein [uncultured Sphingorhabdus sp.]HMS20794.1 DUF2817 domain-containing protein [Sphingorhabdus sp.]
MKSGEFATWRPSSWKAVNCPLAFAHQQRVNENNVDLNRNFIAFDRIPDNHGYHELHPSLMLDEWSDAAFETAFDSMDAFRHRHGEKAFSDAFNGGQYAHDDGIFFGGREPQWSNRVFRKMLHEAIGPLADVHFLDIHTGIGAYGRPFHINFDKPGTRSRMLTEAVWGSDVFSNKESTHTAFASYQGLLMDAVVARDHWSLPGPTKAG